MLRHSLETRIKTLVFMEALTNEEFVTLLSPDDQDPQKIQTELQDATFRGDAATAAVKTMQLLRRGIFTPKDAAIAMTEANHGATSFYSDLLDTQKDNDIIEPVDWLRRSMTRENMEAARDESVRREIRWAKLTVEASNKEQGIH